MTFESAILISCFWICACVDLTISAHLPGSAGSHGKFSAWISWISPVKRWDLIKASWPSSHVNTRYVRNPNQDSGEVQGRWSSPAYWAGSPHTNRSLATRCIPSSCRDLRYLCCLMFCSDYICYHTLSLRSHIAIYRLRFCSDLLVRASLNRIAADKSLSILYSDISWIERKRPGKSHRLKPAYSYDYTMRFIGYDSTQTRWFISHRFQIRTIT